MPLHIQKHSTWTVCGGKVFVKHKEESVCRSISFLWEIVILERQKIFQGPGVCSQIPAVNPNQRPAQTPFKGLKYSSPATSFCKGMVFSKHHHGHNIVQWPGSCMRGAFNFRGTMVECSAFIFEAGNKKSQLLQVLVSFLLHLYLHKSVSASMSSHSTKYR